MTSPIASPAERCGMARQNGVENTTARKPSVATGTETARKRSPKRKPLPKITQR